MRFKVLGRMSFKIREDSGGGYQFSKNFLLRNIHASLLENSPLKLTEIFIPFFTEVVAPRRQTDRT